MNKHEPSVCQSVSESFKVSMLSNLVDMTLPTRPIKGLAILAFVAVCSPAFGQSDLFVSAGDTLFVQPNTILHATNAVTGTGFVQLKADATGYAQLDQTNDVTNTAKVILGKRLANTTDGWRAVSFPFTGTLGDLDFNSTMSFVNANNNGGISARDNFFGWNATDAGSGEATGWFAMGTTQALPSSSLVYMANNGFHDFSQDLMVTGTPANGDVSFNLIYTLDPAYTSGNVDDATGWNLIPNPYPTILSLDALFNSTGFPTYEAVHVYDQVSGGQNKAIMPNGVAINYNTPGGSDNTVYHLAPMEGFWVKTNVNQTLTITNDVRDPDTSAASYMKTAPYELLRLNVFSSTDTRDQIVVYYDATSTPGFEPNRDAIKKYAAGLPSLGVELDTRDLSIVGVPEGDYTFDLRFIAPYELDVYTFNVDDSQLDPWSDVILEDRLVNAFYDLRVQRKVNIQLIEGDYQNRFRLHVNKSGLSVEENAAGSGVMRCWKDANGNVQVQTPEELVVESVEVFNLAGQLIWESNPSASDNIEIPMLPNPGAYLIRVEYTNGQIATEKLIY